MTVWKHATVRIDVTVNFEDDGTNDLAATAIETATDFLRISEHDLDAIEIVGGVYDGKVK